MELQNAPQISVSSCHVHLAVFIFCKALLQSQFYFQANKVSQYRFVYLLYKLNWHLNILEQEHLQLIFILHVLGSQEVSPSCKVVLFPTTIAIRGHKIWAREQDWVWDSMTFQFLIARFIHVLSRLTCISSCKAHLCLYPTRRARAMEMSQVWNWKIILALNLVLEVQSNSPY